MSPSAIRILDLRAPLTASDEERLSVFTLNPKIATSIDDASARPEDFFLGMPGKDIDQIPAGRYLFYQINGDSLGTVSPAELIHDAMELQKEGLWRGETLDDRLFLRELTEEGSTVRQLLRPLLSATKQ